MEVDVLGSSLLMSVLLNFRAFKAGSMLPALYFTLEIILILSCVMLVKRSYKGWKADVLDL